MTSVKELTVQLGGKIYYTHTRAHTHSRTRTHARTCTHPADLCPNIIIPRRPTLTNPFNTVAHLRLSTLDSLSPAPTFLLLQLAPSRALGQQYAAVCPQCPWKLQDVRRGAKSTGLTVPRKRSGEVGERDKEERACQLGRS